MAKKTKVKTGKGKVQKRKCIFYHSYGAQGVIGATHICACGQIVTVEVENHNKQIQQNLKAWATSRDPQPFSTFSKCNEPRCPKCKKELKPGGVSVAT